MASRSGTRASHNRTPAALGAGGQPNGQDPLPNEQEVSQNGGGNQGEVPLPPPPPFGDLTQAISNQTLILEALASGHVTRGQQRRTAPQAAWRGWQQLPLLGVESGGGDESGSGAGWATEESGSDFSLISSSVLAHFLFFLKSVLSIRLSSRASGCRGPVVGGPRTASGSHL